MPQQMSLNIYRGDCYHWTFTFWTDPDATQAYDLTGATAKAEIRPKSGGAILAELTCTVLEPNTVEVELLTEDSEKLSSGKAVWDLQITFPDGCVKTLVAGGVVVTADVTDSSLVSP